MRKTHTLSVAMKNLVEVPDSLFQQAQEEGVSTVDFSKNRFSAVPEGY